MSDKLQGRMVKLDLNKNIYECSNCEKQFNWNENSSWYGSLGQMDFGEIKIYSCSDKCQQQLIINGKIL